MSGTVMPEEQYFALHTLANLVEQVSDALVDRQERIVQLNNCGFWV